MIARIAHMTLGAVLAMCLAAGMAGATDRVALVIGNASYEKSGWALRNPVNDARAVASALSENGFVVTTLEDATSVEMSAAIRQFRRDLSAAVSDHGPEATGLVYYAGHGLQDHAGVNWLPGVDLDADVIQDVPGQALRLGVIVDQMAQAGAFANIIIVNACRDAPFASAYRSGQAGRGMTREPAQDRMLIAYGAQPGAAAADFVEDGDQLSPFAAAFLHAVLNEGSAYDVLADAAANTVALTNGAQRPLLEYSPTPDDRIRSFSFLKQGEIGEDERARRLAELEGLLNRSRASGEPRAPIGPSSPASKPAIVFDGRDPAFVGCWRWGSNQTLVRAEQNGVLSVNGGSPTRWERQADGSFHMVWLEVAHVITLQGDGSTLSSVDPPGGAVSTATRLEGPKDSFEGTWRWDNGGVVEAKADGVLRLGELTGSWSKSGDAFRAVWPLYEIAQVSEDRQELSAVTYYAGNPTGQTFVSKRIACP